MQSLKITVFIFLFYTNVIAKEETKSFENLTIKKICEKKENSDHLKCTLIAQFQNNVTAGELIYEEIDEKNIKICYLLVSKNMRNKGIGKALMAHFLREIENKNCQIVEVFSAIPALGFYKKFGFHCEQESFEPGLDNTCFCYRSMKE